ncbi:MAG TPA: cyclic nucleotide-binding domain-containing protein [Bryobacteraceae bacterium]|nr:cyclic nucleotide-binding domain-containing protein [Bryobacteraceae bacterium]
MKTIELTIDEKPATVEEGTSVFDAARMHGITIPVLCHAHNERPVGVCRVCVVDCGDKVLQASCVRPAENGMKVFTASEKVRKHRRMVLELLMSDHPSPCARQTVSGDCELETQAAAEGITAPRFSKRVSPRGQDDSSLVISVDHEACILCDRCIRGCDEIRNNNVLGRRGKGYNAGIAFDLNRPMGNSTCVSCGECMVSCPTGALTNKSVVRTVLPGGDPVGADELKQLPFFQKVSGTFLELNKNAVIKRHFKAGDIICREGDYGSTAFYILEGKVQVFLQSMMSQKPRPAEPPGLLDRITHVFSPRRQPPNANQGNIPIDAIVDLSREKPVAELGVGDIFGEMTCMSLYPRSATVRASTDCIMLEMLRNVLDVIQRNKTLRAEIEKNYRKRALEDHLRTVPLFATLSPEFIDELAQKVELVRYSRGEVLCSEGETAHNFFLVRIGFVKMAQEHPGGQLVFAYQGKGGFFGEMGLLKGGIHEFTVTALDNVEVVRIGATEFRGMVDRFPDVANSLRRIAHEREAHNARHSAAVAAVSLDSFLKQGLMEANSLLVIDLEKCTRCDNCVKACSEAHDGFTRLVREGLRFDKYLVPTSCRHCRDPLCMIGCPVGSIRRRNSLETVIEDWCVGCGLCARNCPFGNITMHETPDRSGQKASVKRKATACDLCADLPEPSCVYACPHDAAHRVEPNHFFRNLISAASDENMFVTPADVEGGSRLER